MFIHDAVLESLTCGDTQILASGLSDAIEKLKEEESETGKTGFETQFCVCHSGSCWFLCYLISLKVDQDLMSWTFGAILSIHPSLPTIYCELVLGFGLEIKLW